MAPTDLTLTDDARGITVHVPRTAAEYFEDLEIQLYSMFGDESLVVKERLA